MGVELMEESQQDVSVELKREQPQLETQPAFQPVPKIEFNEQAVRAATIEAAKSGVDPFTMVVGDLKQGQPQITPPVKARAETPVEVPEKFKKPTGEVDVEKLKASTERLDEAIAVKEQKLQEANKTIDDYLLEYKGKEQKLNALPNPEKIMAQFPAQPVPSAPMPQNLMGNLSDQQLEEMISNDMRTAPGRTVAQLVEIAVEKRLEQRLKPFEDSRKDDSIRNNLKQLAEKDARVLDPRVFQAINAKLDSDPDLWKLKNPHKAAWLEVKDELRLGEVPLGASQAQPSKPPAPVLAGGTPPPAPSLFEPQTSMQALEQAISQMTQDPRNGKIDPKAQLALDRAAKEFFDRMERQRR